MISAANVTSHHNHNTTIFFPQYHTLNYSGNSVFYYVHSYKGDNEFPTYWPEVQKKRSNDYIYYQYCHLIKQCTAHVSNVYNNAATLV